MNTGMSFLRFTCCSFSALNAASIRSLGPSRIISQHPCRQSLGILDANATVTEIAPTLAEQRLRRRGVQVNILIIGKNKLDQAQRVFRPRFLPHHQFSRAQLSQHFVAHYSVGDDLPGIGGHFKIVFLNVRRILGDLGNDLAAQDARAAHSSTARKPRTSCLLQAPVSASAEPARLPRA